MAKRKFDVNIAGFRGLNTEASPLNSLPAELLDGSINVDILRDMSMRRRRALNFVGESTAGGYLQSIASGTTTSLPSQLVPSALTVRLVAPNNTTVDRVIVFINNSFHVYEPTLTGMSNIDMPLQTLAVTSTNIYTDQKFHPVDMDVSDSRVFFAGRYIQPGYISVASDNVTLEITHYDVFSRNFSQTTEGTKVSNAGTWYMCVENHTVSNGKKPGVSAGWERYWIQGQGPQPTSGVSTFTSKLGTAAVRSVERTHSTYVQPTAASFLPHSVEFFAGRVWLCDISTVYYSQTIVDAEDIPRFFAASDPFNVNDPEVVEDDGGFLKLEGASETFQLQELDTNLFISSNAGVHQVIGSDGIFKATNFSVIRVIKDAILNSHSMVATDATVVVFGANRIWESSSSLDIGINNQTKFKSISDDTVDTLYSAISKDKKRKSRAIYSGGDKRVYYFYVSDDTDEFMADQGIDNAPGYATHALTYDSTSPEDVAISEEQTRRILSQAFTLQSYAPAELSGTPYVAAAFVNPPVAVASSTVVDGTDTIVRGSDTVVTGSSTVGTEKDALHSVVLRRAVVGSAVTYYWAFATHEGTFLKDYAPDSTYQVDYTSKAALGYQNGGNIKRKKGIKQIYLLFNKVSDGSCMLRTAQQYAFSNSSTKYGSQQETYTDYRYPYGQHQQADDGMGYAWYRHRVRGRGDVTQVLLESSEDKDFHVVGMSESLYGS